MNFTNALKAYLKKPKVKNLTREIIRWKEEEQLVLGKIVAIEEFTNNKTAEPCKQYVIDTVDGEKSFILGNRMDKELERVDIINHIICVTYKGKISLESGRKMNVFQIADLSDIPFEEIMGIEKGEPDGKLDENSSKGETKTDSNESRQ